MNEVHGRKMTFSEEERIAIVEKHLASETTDQTITKVVQKPPEDLCFYVKPQTIDQKLFEKKRKDKSQEKTRHIILEAFVEMKKNPKKYGKNFKTMIPRYAGVAINLKQVEKMVRQYGGDHCADWCEQALEWAQRITNGESWEAICNDYDKSRWYRLIRGKNGYMIVGGSLNGDDYYPASYVRSIYDCIVNIDDIVDLLDIIVPLIVYED